jgi:hypothetical protein
MAYLAFLESMRGFGVERPNIAGSR